MPVRLVSKLDLDKLYPPFLDKLLGVLAACEKRGASYFATAGYRTAKEQAKLYFQGRTLPGEIVTNARPGQSLHEYGVAADVVRDHSDWTPSHYTILADEGDKAGLQVNVPKGNDYGHIQLPLRGRLNRRELDVVDMLKAAGSLKGAWALLDVVGPW